MKSKNTLAKNFFLLLIQLVWSINLLAQWQETSGPSGNISCITIKNPANIFIGSNVSGIYKSSDYGLTWNHLNIPTPATVVSINIQGDHIYATVEGVGVYASVDSGATWTPMNNGL